MSEYCYYDIQKRGLMINDECLPCFYQSNVKFHIDQDHNLCKKTIDK